jgi:diketogulonate reductase-like aldo/keto reductase
VEFCKEHGIVVASYGGQTPIVRAPEKSLPLNDVLSTIRERLAELRGQPVTLGQVLSKWILQKGAIVVTSVLRSVQQK